MPTYRRTEDSVARVTDSGILRVIDDAASAPAILMEDGASYILLEDGSRILLE